MAESLDPLILDLVEWIAREPRAYADVIDAWRTSCPRLTVWEDAMDRGFVERTGPRSGTVVVTQAGRAFLRERGRVQAPTLAQPRGLPATAGKAGTGSVQVRANLHA